jgi:hypothetical protein
MSTKRIRLNEQNNPLTPTDRVLLGMEQAAKPVEVEEEVNQQASYQSVKPASQQVNNTASRQSVKPASQQVDNTTSQQVSKEELRKATFQLSAPVLKRLERFHLELQLELGKESAPFKEVIVEEALSYFLEQANTDRNALITALLDRQSQRV